MRGEWIALCEGTALPYYEFSAIGDVYSCRERLKIVGERIVEHSYAMQIVYVYRMVEAVRVDIVCIDCDVVHTGVKLSL